MLDSFDKAILAALQMDATLSVDDLAARVHLSRNACWRRMKKLEEDGYIRARVALLEPEKLNVGLAVFVQVRTNRHSAEWAAQFCAAVRDIPEIVGAYRTTGDVDYILHARVPSVAAYDRLYNLLTSRIELSDVSASFVMEEIKEVTALPLGFV